jgi:hypothetical protein
MKYVQIRISKKNVNPMLRSKAQKVKKSFPVTSHPPQKQKTRVRIPPGFKILRKA